MQKEPNLKKDAPQSQSHKNQKEASSSPGLEGHSQENSKPLLLIIENEAQTLNELSEEAHMRGFDVVTAISQEETRQKLLQTPDVILLSIDSDEGQEADALQGRGCAFLKKITEGSANSHKGLVPVVVCASGNSITDRVEASRLGASAFIQKPKAPAHIIDVVVNQLEDRRSAVGKVLVVAPPLEAAQVTHLLNLEGYHFRTLNDPRQFWKALDEFSPDLIIMDLDLPHLSGLELCQVVRSDPRWHLLPVIFLAEAAKHPNVLNEVFIAGGDDFVDLHNMASQLLIRIKNRLGRTRIFTRLAEIDPLTGLKNRRSSTMAISQLMSLSRSQHQPFSLAILDLDNFKSINDIYSHAVGDIVLRRLGILLLNSFRGKDITARWGGEEIVVGMFGLNREQGVHRIAEVLDAFRRTTFKGSGQRPFNVTFSAGVAEYPSDGLDLRGLYRSADGALYKAKYYGRCRVLPAKWRSLQSNQANCDLMLFSHNEELRKNIASILNVRGCFVRYTSNLKSVADNIRNGVKIKSLAIDVESASPQEVMVLQEMFQENLYSPSCCIMLIPDTRTLPFPLPDAEGLRILGKPFVSYQLMGTLRKAWDSKKAPGQMSIC